MTVHQEISAHDRLLMLNDIIQHHTSAMTIPAKRMHPMELRELSNFLTIAPAEFIRLNWDKFEPHLPGWKLAV